MSDHPVPWYIKFWDRETPKVSQNSLLCSFCRYTLYKKEITLFSKYGTCRSKCLHCLIKNTFITPSDISSLKYYKLHCAYLTRDITGLLQFVQSWVFFGDQMDDLEYFLDRLLHCYFELEEKWTFYTMLLIDNSISLIY
jgi:hypothetical protein